VSRLASRVAIRALAVFLLLVGMAGGLYLGGDPKTQHGMDDASRAGSGFLLASAEQRAAEKEARKKATAEAKQVAARARAAEEAARQAEEEASRSETRVDIGPIPASCNEYEGNRAIGCKLTLDWGFTLDQMACLDQLFTKESGWTTTAQNPSTGAYGIPQALPGSKMAKFGDDWQTNPATQIGWGRDDIKGRYSSPCGAWEFFLANGWY
jgi:hypothetical protein